MSNKNNAENYTEKALKNFQRCIFLCDIDFQSSCDFLVSFSVKNWMCTRINYEAALVLEIIHRGMFGPFDYL